MAIDFPNTPAVNSTFTVGVTTWKWDGTKWNVLVSSVQGPAGIPGLQGLQGVQGLLGVQGLSAVTLPINTQTGSTYTLVLSDADGDVSMNNASANTLSIPLNSSVNFPVGTQIVITQLGAGQTTISGVSGVTVYSYLNRFKLSGQYAQASLLQHATNVWILSGNVSS
jgi:hypothetical protein